MDLILAYTLTFTVTGLMIALLAADPLRTSAAQWFFKSKLRPWTLPTTILALYVIVTLLSGGWGPREFLLVGLYFIVPTFLIWRGSPRTSQATLVDVILILLIWFPQEFGVFDVHWVSIGALRWPLGIFVTVIYMLLLLTGWKDIELGCPGNLRWVDLGAVGGAYLLLSAVILPLGMAVGFLLPGLNKNLMNDPGGLILTLLGIFFAVAIPEELLFRGWIQNLLLTRLKFVPGLVTAAVIFGLSHLDNRVVTSARMFEVPDWWYALFATVAGLAYGYIYQKRRSLFASALLHTLVDFTWVLFLRG
jgi:membrane protease YdiL (CAAX protease family)